MKKYLLGFLCLFLLVGCTGCQRKVPSEVKWNNTTVFECELSDFLKDITATVVEVQEEAVTVEFANNGDETWRYGTIFHLDVRIGENWYHVPMPDIDWDLVGYEVEPGERRIEEYNLVMFGDLPAGIYRLIADYEVAVEFEK